MEAKSCGSVRWENDMKNDKKIYNKKKTKQEREARRVMTMLIWASVLLIACVVGCVILMTMDNAGSKSGDGETNAVLPLTETTPGPTESGLAATGPVSGETVVVIPQPSNGQASGEPFEVNQVIFVGDSRTVGMSMFVECEDEFLCDNGVGLTFLQEHKQELLKLATADKVVVVALGVNDCYDDCWAPQYVEYLNELADELPCPLVYSRVLAVEEMKELEHGYATTNRQVERFNEKVGQELSAKIRQIDVREQVAAANIHTIDGLHFDEQGYNDIYRFMRRAIEEVLS